MPYRRPFAFLILLALLLPLPAAGQEIPPVSQRPEMPAEVFLPAGVERPDLTGYEIVTLRPGDLSEWTALFERSKRPFDGKAVAVLFAPGLHDHGEGVWKKLFRNTQGTEEKPVYIGPADPSAPLPVLVCRAEFFGSYHVLVQGLVLTDGAKITAVSVTEERPNPIAPKIEGCWLGGGVSAQSGSAKDGSKLPVIGAVLERCWIVGARGQGIYADHSQGLTLRECVIDFAGASSTRDHAVYLNQDENVLIERCILTRASSSALKLMATKNMVVRDCFIALNHNYISANANPTPSGDRNGENLLFEGNVVTRSGRRGDEPGEKTSGGRSYLGWSFSGITLRGNLFVHDKGMSHFRFQKAIYDASMASTGRDFVIEGNVSYAASGHFVTVTADADVSGIVVRNNVVAEPADWGTLHTNPLKGVETAERAEAIGLFLEGNLWPAWAPIDTRPETTIALSGGEPAQVEFHDPTRTIATFARDVLGAEASEAAFFHSLSRSDPGVMIADLLSYFREGYEIVGIAPGVPPASIPWIDGEDGPEDPIENEPPPEEPTEPDPPVEEPGDGGAGPENPPETEEPEEPAPPAAGEVLAVIRVPSGDEWIEIVIKRVR